MKLARPDASVNPLKPNRTTWPWHTCVLASIVLVALSFAPAQGQTLTTLHSFAGGTDGSFPFAGLVRDSAGNLYGTTAHGGNSSFNCENGAGCGTVFKVDATGKETVLYVFTGGTDGGLPETPVIRDAKGNIFGTTFLGGSVSRCNGIGCGVVFKLTPSRTFSVVYDFTDAPDGSMPMSGLVEDAKGNLYGTTSAGGTSSRGTVFQIDANGKEAVLHSFSSGTDGGFPLASLLRDSAGNLMGTTSIGGTALNGVVFKVDSTGHESVTHSFTGRNEDGSTPYAGLVASGSFLYGTTAYGGSSDHGTVFRSDKTGKVTVVHSFTGSDGATPSASLVRDSAGNLYGTTATAGVFGFGTVFKVDITGNVTVLHSFSNGSDGATPTGGLVLDSAGNLYGTTQGAGDFGFGTVFKIVP